MFQHLRRRDLWFAAFGAVLVSLWPNPCPAQEGGPDVPQAVTQVEAAGGRVEHQDMDPEKPVTAVNFATKPVGDSDLIPLGAFVHLEKLTLNNTQITDAGLEHLKSLVNLKKLYLVDTSITDAGIESIKSLPALEILSLVGTKITDEGLKHLESLDALRSVFLAGTGVTDEGVQALREARPMLEIIR